MRLLERSLPQYQPWCDWCGIAVGSWYSQRVTMLRVLVIHRRLHRSRGLIGRSVTA